MSAAVVCFPSAPLQDLVVRKSLEQFEIPLVDDVHSVPETTKLILWCSYDEMDFEFLQRHRERTLVSSYVIRKALIRKHYLSRTLHSYIVKHKDSILTAALPATYDFELAHADELDELFMDELWELNRRFTSEPGRWWILKPGMADRGNDIRLFHNRSSLEDIFQSYEMLEDEDDDNSTTVISQLRHFVVQEYVEHPLLFDPRESGKAESSDSLSLQGTKFHLRAYCLSVGALSVFLYDRVLALFSSAPYKSPDTGPSGLAQDLAGHLTNTSLQMEHGEENVRLLDELIGCGILSAKTRQTFSSEDAQNLLRQMQAVLGECFAAAVESPINFQATENAFELFGVDFLVEHSPQSGSFQAKLLEFNAEPAIELTGPRLTWILEDLFRIIGRVCVSPFIASESSRRLDNWEIGETRENLIKCYEMRVRPTGPS